jgi:hypothetical protein
MIRTTIALLCLASTASASAVDLAGQNGDPTDEVRVNQRSASGSERRLNVEDGMWSNRALKRKM